MLSASFLLLCAMIANIVFIAVIGIGLSAIFGSYSKQILHTTTGLDMALLLKQRYARGEISSEELQRLKQELYNMG